MKLLLNFDLKNAMANAYILLIIINYIVHHNKSLLLRYCHKLSMI